jgi:hypothetical protein
MDIFRYLFLVEDFIWLLELQPGQDGDLVKCNLRYARLQKFVLYEALSYTWGDPKIVHYIQLDEHQFGITSNLMSALLPLRLRDKLRLLWINAVCINQLDNDEETRQVMLMRKIYEHALRVLVWLGEGSEESSLSLRMIPKLLEVQKHQSDFEARLLTDLDQWDGAGLPEADEPH